MQRSLQVQRTTAGSVHQFVAETRPSRWLLRDRATQSRQETRIFRPFTGTKTGARKKSGALARVHDSQPRRRRLGIALQGTGVFFFFHLLFFTGNVSFFLFKKRFQKRAINAANPLKKTTGKVKRTTATHFGSTFTATDARKRRNPRQSRERRRKSPALPAT